MRSRSMHYLTMAVALVVVGAQQRPLAHVTMRASEPLVTAGSATVSLVVPNERYVDTTRVTLEVPDDFLRNGGRITRLEYPPDWKVRVEKEDIPSDIYRKSAAARKPSAKDSATQGASLGSEGAAQAQREEELLDQMRRKWIKRIIFEDGSIPPDGFREFRFSIQMPAKPGAYRFPATQLYADGKNEEWMQLVEDADRPAPALVVNEPPRQVRWVRITGGAILVLAALLLLLRLARTKRVPARV